MGTSLRPKIESQIGVGSNDTGPGQYPIKSMLGGAHYSFTTAGWIEQKKDSNNAEFILQPSTFGYPNAFKA